MTAAQDKERVYGDPDLAWRVLGLLNVFRLLVPTVLYSVAALSASPRYLGSTLPWLFSATVVAMYVMGVLCIGMLKRRWPDLRLQAYVHIAFDVTALTALDYLGFGLPPPTPSWGELLAQGTANLQAPWIVTSVVVAMTLVLLMVAYIGEAIREAFDPKKFTFYE